MIDSVFNGIPTSITPPSGQASLGVDISTGNMYYRSPNSDGWKSAGGTNGGTNGGFNLFATLPNMKVIPVFTPFSGVAKDTKVDIYTVPAGRRAVIMSFSATNSGTPSVTIDEWLKISGSYYPLLSVVAPAHTGNVQENESYNQYIFEEGETLSLSPASNGFVGSVLSTLLEFSNTTSLRTVKIVNPSTGNTVLYTPTPGTNGITVCLENLLWGTELSNGPAGGDNLSGGSFVAISTTQPQCILNLIHGGSSYALCAENQPIFTNFICNIFLDNDNCGINRIGIASGDSLSVNLSAPMTGLIAVTVYET